MNKIKNIDEARVHETFEWIEAVLGEKLEHDIQKTLKSGVVLIKLVSKITGNDFKIEKPGSNFKEMENISRFLTQAKLIGCPDQEIFVTNDLYEAKNLSKVLECLGSLARNAAQKGYKVPLLGPKLADKNERVFSEEKLREGRSIPSFLTSNERSAQYANDRAGGDLVQQAHLPRQIADQRIQVSSDGQQTLLTNTQNSDPSSFGNRRQIGGKYE